MRSVRIAAAISFIVMAITVTRSPFPTSIASAAVSQTIGHSVAAESLNPFDLPTPAYDIEAYDYYCDGGGSACTPVNGDVCDHDNVYCPGFHYAEVFLIGPATGATSGTPIYTNLECDTATPAGLAYAFVNIASPVGYADFGSSLLEPDLGVISGNAALLDWFRENPTDDPNYPDDNPAQVSSGSVTVYDPPADLRATVTGIQNTDNTDDLPNAGGFKITLTGEISLRTYGSNPTTSTYNGTISCFAGGPHAADVQNGTGEPGVVLAEGELETDVIG